MSQAKPSRNSRPAGTPLERVAALKDVIRAGGDEAQTLRRVPGETVDALVDAGLFRFTIPRALGGEDASAIETMEVIEAISAIDGSVGWNVMLGSELNAMSAGGMPLDVARKVFVENPRVIMCGGGGPGSTPGRAEKQPDGGYRIWSHMTFASGCHNAEWCFMMAPIMTDGKLEAMPQITVPNQTPVGVKLWMINKSQFQILDTWDVASLRGSGSHDIKTEGGYVEPGMVDVNLIMTPALHDNPVFRIPMNLRLSYNKAAVALGIARGALDAFAELAQAKTPTLSVTKLMDRPIAQHRMGEAEAMVRAARAFVFEAMERVEDELRAGREAPSADANKAARLACVFAADASMKMVDLIHNSAGTSAISMKHPLERKLRDAHGCAAHRWLSHSLYAEIGKFYLGYPPTPEFGG